VKGWNEKAQPDEGAYDAQVLHHSANTLGAATGRFTHKLVVNVPRVSTKFGKELRSLFIPPAGCQIVGWDAMALESVIEAHYCYVFDKDYAWTLYAGDSDKGTDIHTLNAKKLGITRDKAKTFKYAITYGAGPKRLAEQIGVTEHEAKVLYDAFWETNTALANVKGKVIGIWKRKGYIPGLDGRKIQCKSEYSVLNYLFQSGGAILMKHALLLAEHLIKEEELAARRILSYHDEEQWVSIPPCANRVGELGVRSIQLAGKELLRVPVTGAYKIGPTWADTH
jgi:DNA polymerase I-like protein with 3'-5' exonuclease and polymerase domains